MKIFTLSKAQGDLHRQFLLSYRLLIESVVPLQNSIQGAENLHA